MEKDIAKNGDLSVRSGTETVDAVEHCESAELPEHEAIRRLKLYRETVANDPNFTAHDLKHLDDAVDMQHVSKTDTLIEEIWKDSPYPEVSLPDSLSPIHQKPHHDSGVAEC